MDLYACMIKTYMHKDRENQVQSANRIPAT